MQTLKSGKWLLKLLHIITCFFNLPQSFFCLQRRHREHRDFFLHGIAFLLVIFQFVTKIAKNINSFFSMFSVSLVVFYFFQFDKFTSYKQAKWHVTFYYFSMSLSNCVVANKLSSPHIPQKNRRNTTFYPKSALSHLLNALFCISSKKTQNPGIFCLI